MASKGCVFRCINLWLEHVNLKKLKIQELRAGMQEVWKDCRGDIKEFEKNTGVKSLGDLYEDESCYPQRLAKLCATNT